MANNDNNQWDEDEIYIRRKLNRAGKLWADKEGEKSTPIDPSVFSRKNAEQHMQGIISPHHDADAAATHLINAALAASRRNKY